MLEVLLLAVGAPSAELLRGRPELLERLSSALDEAGALGEDTAPGSTAFARHVGEQLGRTADVARAIELLHARDLAMALACVEGKPGALAWMETSIFAKLGAPLARVDASPAFVAEVVQHVRTWLLLPREDGPPRLMDYSGMGPLRSWVRATAVRAALRMRKAKGQEEPTESEVLARHALPDVTPEAMYLRADVRQHVREALAQVVRTLDTEEQEVLRLFFVDQLSLTRMGELLGLHKSTLSRRLSAAHSLLEKRTRKLLADRLALSTPELESLMRAVRSQLDLSLSGVFGAPR